MRLTKYEHSALQLDQSGEKLFVDPGAASVPTDTTPAPAAPGYALHVIDGTDAVTHFCPVAERF